MFRLIKKLFRRSAKATVYKNGKAYKFNDFNKAIAFMMM
jgi:hypothetical protein